jgi:hypothetical protein
VPLAPWMLELWRAYWQRQRPRPDLAIPESVWTTERGVYGKPPCKGSNTYSAPGAGMSTGAR